jgi:hypothetical protein
MLEEVPHAGRLREQGCADLFVNAVTAAIDDD